MSEKNPTGVPTLDNRMEYEKKKDEKIEKINKIILDFFKENNVKKGDTVMIYFKEGLHHGGNFWYEFHSLSGGNFNGFFHEMRGGTREMMRNYEERERKARGNDKWTDSISFREIEKIGIGDFAQRKYLTLPDIDKI